ncbi:hypothetical protein TKK_0013187 [Trichogramma kaykai]
MKFFAKRGLFEKLTDLEKHWYEAAELGEACLVHLYEKRSRKFFQSWAIEPFMELIHYRLPILCCDMIIEHLPNEDLCNICLAAADRSS